MGRHLLLPLYPHREKTIPMNAAKMNSRVLHTNKGTKHQLENNRTEVTAFHTNNTIFKNI